jgi:hypothetical protein
MNAATPGVFSMSFSPFSGPSIATAEERPSVLNPSGPTTVTLLRSVSAMPVRGSIR